MRLVGKLFQTGDSTNAVLSFESYCRMITGFIKSAPFVFDNEREVKTLLHIL